MGKYTAKARLLKMRPLGNGVTPDKKYWDALRVIGLPTEYLEFLTEFRVTQVFDADVCFPVMAPTAEDGLEALDVLFARSGSVESDLLEVNSGNDRPPRMLIIGEASTNPLCLMLDTGGVVLWDALSRGKPEKNLYPVAKSFAEFFALLRVVVEKEDTRRRIVSFVLSDDLKAKAAEYLRRKNTRGDG